eukprot:scaffold21283_cov37-Phaeocystis_antarctica.AAC.2
MPSVTRGTVSQPTPRAFSARPCASLLRAKRRALSRATASLSPSCRLAPLHLPHTSTCSDSAVSWRQKMHCQCDRRRSILL